MKGQGFEYTVKEGQTVEAGQPLLTFSRKDIKAAGHPDTVLMIVTEDNGVSGITMHPGQDLKAGEGDVTTW